MPRNQFFYADLFRFFPGLLHRRIGSHSATLLSSKGKSAKVYVRMKREKEREIKKRTRERDKA